MVGLASGVKRALKRVASPALSPLVDTLLLSRAADLTVACRHGPRTEQRVALTFDDGPVRGGTEAVQDALGELGAPGTFFCVGANALRHPELILRGYQAGHVIGAHSMRHRQHAAIQPFGAAHIDDCLKVLRDVIGRTPGLYRPPNGWLTPWETLRLRRRGLRIIRWDVDPRDWQMPSAADEMCARTLAQVRPGSIIVCHDGFAGADRYERPATVRMLRRLIPALRDQGYTLVTVPQLLGISAYQDGDDRGSTLLARGPVLSDDESCWQHRERLGFLPPLRSAAEDRAG